MSDDLEALKAELEIEKAKLKALQDQINPPPRQPYVYQPVDYTANAKMPASALKAMVDASSSYISDLRADARRPNPVNPPTPPQPQPQVRRSTGWRDEVPLGPPNTVIDWLMRRMQRTGQN
jgi:hypothetical protein